MGGPVVSLQTLPCLQNTNSQLGQTGNSNIHLSTMNDNKNSSGARIVVGIGASSQPFQSNQKMQQRAAKNAAVLSTFTDSPSKAGAGPHPKAAMNKSVVSSGAATTINSITVSDKNNNYHSLKSTM